MQAWEGLVVGGVLAIQGAPLKVEEALVVLHRKVNGWTLSKQTSNTFVPRSLSSYWCCGRHQSKIPNMPSNRGAF